MKGLPAVLFCIVLADCAGRLRPRQGQGADREEGDGTGPEQGADARPRRKRRKAQKAPTLAQKKQQDRWGECNKQATGDSEGRGAQEFMSSCLGGGA